MASKILIIAVGRMGRGPEADLLGSYLKRLPWPVSLEEIDDRKAPGQGHQKAWEAERILEKLPAGGIVYALDERGKNLSSQELVDALGQARDLDTPISFIIGGADGLDPKVRQAATHLLAFGKATWPHKLVRAMMVEQIYRAVTILTGHPYHRA